MMLRENRHIDYREIEQFGERYLTTYYKDNIDPDEYYIADFLVREYRKIKSQPVALEIGCGPTVHHALLAAPHVSQIDMADYLPSNLSLIRRWKGNALDSFSWNHYTSMVLAAENAQPTAEAKQQREDLTRRKIANLLTCDLLCDPPFVESKTYSLVTTFYCTEEVTADKSEWKGVMQRIANLVEPGGYLFLTALRATDFYHLAMPDGTREVLPTAYLLEKDFEEILPEIGFEPQFNVIETRETPETQEDGIPGIIMVSAKKKK